MISHEHKFIFVHIPKCAGCSLKEHLVKNSDNNPINSGHQPLDVLLKNFSLKSEDYYKFTFIRNPWDRIVSLYFFWLNQTPDSVFYQWDFEQVNFIKDNNLSFIDFVKLIPFNDSVFNKKPHLYPYIDHFMGDPTSFNFIGRLENFQQDFDIVCEKIGIPSQQLPRINKSEHKHYIEYYDDETRAIVAEKYAKDIEYFQYRFGA